MADVKKVITIEIDAETGEVKKLNKELDKTEKQTKDSKKGIDGMAKGFKGVGVAIKAAGIGLLLGVLAKLTDLLGRNQKVMDTLTTATNALGIAFNDFFGFISDNVGTVTQYFKDLFENPGDKLKEIADTIKNYVVGNVKLLIEGFGTLGEAMSFLLDGQFSKAFETAKSGASQVGEALLKLNPATAVVANLAETIYDNRDAISQYAKETLAAAQSMTDAAAASQFLEVESRRLQLQYQLQAEELRQIRDDETRSLDERIEANRMLGDVLVEAAEVEKQVVQQRINNLQKELDLLGPNRDLELEIANLRVEQLDIDERIAGVRSEFLSNQNALLKEQKELLQDIVRLEEDDFDFGDITKEIDAEYQKQEAIRQANQETEDFLAELYEKRFQEQQQAEMDEMAREEAKAAAKKALEQEVANNAINLLGTVASLADGTTKRGFAIQKAAAIAAATANTAQAVTKTLAETVDPTPTQTLRFINAALVGAAGAAQIAAIARTKFTGGGGGSAAPVGGRGGGAGSPNIQFNTVGASGINQLNESIVAQNTAVKAYVVSSEVSSAQSLDRNRQSNATFG